MPSIVVSSFQQGTMIATLGVFVDAGRRRRLHSAPAGLRHGVVDEVAGVGVVRKPQVRAVPVGVRAEVDRVRAGGAVEHLRLGRQQLFEVLGGGPGRDRDDLGDAVELIAQSVDVEQELAVGRARHEQ